MRKIAENYKLPYYTLSPTYSVCKNHGYLSGEVSTCPECGERTEIYSRITGYYRPVQNWNDGKAQEFKDRKVYDIGHSHLTHQGVLHPDVKPEITPEQPDRPAETPAGNTCGAVKLFATRTCPNCKQAEKLLADAGIPFTRLLAEENGAEAARLGIRQAPTLVVGDGEDKYVGLAAVRQFIAQYNS